MTWVKMDDGYPEHPKVDRVGPLAAWLNVCAWAYCARNLTDGFVPVERVSRLASVSNPSKLAVALVDAHLWELVDGGYSVHDYLVYNPSRDQVLADRAKTAERVAKHRNGVGNGVTPPDTNGGSNGRSKRVGNGVSTEAPYPVPSPTRPKREPPAATQRAPLAGRRRTEVDEEFKQTIEDEFWEAFGSREAVRDCIDDAMGHKALLQRTDQRAYLKTWVRRDAARAQSRPGAPRRQPSSPVKFAPRAALPPCEQCHTFERESQRDDGLCTLCAVKANQAAKGLRTMGGAA